MYIRTIALGIFLCSLLGAGIQAADSSSQPPSVFTGITGLEALQPDSPPLEISAYAGIATLIVIFADEPEDADFMAQLDILRARSDAFARRNVVLLTDTAPSAEGPLRQSLRPRGFGILLIDTEGVLKQRRRTVTDARTLIRQIDQMP